MITRYKFLREINGKIKSDSGNEAWTIGEWKKTKGVVKLCERGFHCSKKVYQAFSYIQGEILAVVECKGASDIQNDKEAYSEMRIVKAYKWQKGDSVDLAIYCAKLVLKNFEDVYPNDDRPRKAIEAAIAYKKCPCEAHQSAAWSAESAAIKKIDLWMTRRINKLKLLK